MPFVFWLKNIYHSHDIIQAFNTIFLWHHDQDINCDHNLQVSHILCILKKKYNRQMTYKNSYIHQNILISQFMVAMVW